MESIHYETQQKLCYRGIYIELASFSYGWVQEGQWKIDIALIEAVPFLFFSNEVVWLF